MNHWFRGYAYWGQPGNNPGDLIVELGTKSLLEKCRVNRDIFITAGTPWFWPGCEKDEKYSRIFHEICSTTLPKIAIGIGICVGVDNNLESLMAVETMAMCANVFSKFDLITCRSEVVCDYLERLGIKSYAIPCPSLWANEEGSEVRAGSTLYVGAQRFHDKYSEPVKPELNGDVTYFETTRGAWTECGIRNLLRFYASHERIVSERIHAAIPSSPFVKASVLPVDGRFKAAILAGIPVYPDFSDPERTREIKDKAFRKYQELLSPFMES